MEKYYTPQIEEFRNGFYYEELHGNRWGKLKFNFELRTLNQINNDIMFNKIQVKILDYLDIEDLGFSRYLFTNAWILGDFYITIEYAKTTELPIVSIWNEFTGDDLFYGNIKNINELKIVLKQLAIL